MTELKQQKLVQVVSEDDLIKHSLPEVMNRFLDEFEVFVGQTVQDWLHETGCKINCNKRFFGLKTKRMNKIQRKLWERGLKVLITTRQVNDNKWVTRVKLYQI